MPSNERCGSFSMVWASCSKGAPGETPTRPRPTSVSASTPTSTCAARAASESWRAAKALSSATVTRVRRATSIRRSSLVRPMIGKATSRSAGSAPSITSASDTLATVSPAAPRFQLAPADARRFVSLGVRSEPQVVLPRSSRPRGGGCAPGCPGPPPGRAYRFPKRACNQDMTPAAKRGAGRVEDGRPSPTSRWPSRSR